jgi:uncharacterized membrane protein
VRSNYAYILSVQAVAYYGKIAIHPIPSSSWNEFLERAAVGPLPGLVVVLAGVAFHGTWVLIALATYRIELRYRGIRRRLITVS